MPKTAAKAISSSPLSSDSSLSSAPETALEDTTTPVSVKQTGAVALVEETGIEITQSKKRRRTKETIEAKVPAKRPKRDTGTTISYKETKEEEEEEEEEKGTPTKPLKTPPQKRRLKDKAVITGIESTTVKPEIEEDIDVTAKGAAKRVQRRAKIEVEATTVEGSGSKSTKKSWRTAKVSINAEEEEQASSPTTSKKSKKGKKASTEEQGDKEEVLNGSPKKAKRKRKTKEEKEAEAMPLAARTPGLKLFLGAHVSSAKGVHNAVTNCMHIGGNAFALFLKSQRKWENPPLQEEHKKLFRAACEEHKYDAASHVLPHGSYLVNLAQEDPDKAKQAYDAFLDDLHRCEALGIKLYNFHPGNTGPSPRPSAIARIAHALNRAHAATMTVTPLLENMAGSGNVIGARFEDLRDIIALVHDQTRIGVCLDTCHALAAGYDLRTPSAFAATLAEFDRVVGMKFLRALHLNDSKAPLGSGRDLHQNVGVGFLGLRAFHCVVNEGRFSGLPMVLETPIEVKDGEGRVSEDKGVWAREIKLLEGLVGVDAEGEAFGRLERELSERGEEGRRVFLEGMERREEGRRKKEEGRRKKEERKRERESGKGRGRGGKKGKKGLESDGSAESEIASGSE